MNNNLEHLISTQLQPEGMAGASAEVEKDWFFTFGSSHAHPNGYVVFHGTHASAREQMFDVFGSVWAFQYDSAEAAGVERFNLKLVEDL